MKANYNPETKAVEVEVTRRELSWMWLFFPQLFWAYWTFFKETAIKPPPAWVPFALGWDTAWAQCVASFGKRRYTVLKVVLGVSLVVWLYGVRDAAIAIIVVGIFSFAQGFIEGLFKGGRKTKGRIL